MSDKELSWAEEHRRRRHEHLARRTPGSNYGETVKESWAYNIKIGDGFQCIDCKHMWEFPDQASIPDQGAELTCPACNSANVREVPI